MTIQWQDDAVRMALADQVKKAVDDRDALLAQRAELIVEVEAWKEIARKAVRVIERLDFDSEPAAQVLAEYDNLSDGT